jgi:hypothetical protein
MGIAFFGYLAVGEEAEKINGTKNQNVYLSIYIHRMFLSFQAMNPL